MPSSAGTLLFIFLCAVLSYLLGALPFGLWIGLAWKGVDIRTLGSKNIGATNVLRVLGPAPATVVFLLDTLKGALGIVLFGAVFVSLFSAPMPFHFRALIGVCAILGHSYSPLLRFKGGKGVATSLGALLALHWMAALIGVLAWVIVLAIFRYVSLASLVAAYTLPFSAWQLSATSFSAWQLSPDAEMLWLCIGLAILVTVKHRGNLLRLLHGTEPRIGQRVGAPANSAEAL